MPNVPYHIPVIVLVREGKREGGREGRERGREGGRNREKEVRGNGGERKMRGREGRRETFILMAWQQVVHPLLW